MIDFEQCKLTVYPSEVLAEPAKPIEHIDDNIKKLADRMIDIMIETKGIGLAGPQAGVNLQIFVISLDGTRENARVYINPKIETSGKVVATEEGCLSLPGIYSKIKRYTKCKVIATDLDGNEFTDEGEELYARALQHEYDHLQGTMIKDKMSQVAKIANRKHLLKMQENFDKHNK